MNTVFAYSNVKKSQLYLCKKRPRVMMIVQARLPGTGNHGSSQVWNLRSQDSSLALSSGVHVMRTSGARRITIRLVIVIEPTLFTPK